MTSLFRILSLSTLFALLSSGWSYFLEARWNRPLSLRPPTIPEPAWIIKTPHFAQGDSRWGDQPLALKGAPLRAEGCAVTSACMVLAHLMGGTAPELNPALLNQKVAQNGGFSASGWLSWEAAAAAVGPRFAHVYEGPARHRLIQLNLLRGNPLIVRVRLPSGITHFVVLVGWMEHDYLMLDPARKDPSPLPFSRLGHPIEALRFYTRLP
jgi:hypothetical protein